MNAPSKAADLAHRAVWGSKPANPRFTIPSFREHRNAANTMRSHFDLVAPSGMRSFGWKLMIAKGGYWIAPPSVMRRDADGKPILNADGKSIWDPVIDFVDRAARDRFNAQVLDALRAAHPELFNEAGSAR